MLGVIKKVQLFFASHKRGEVALSHDESLEQLLHKVVDEHFGVYIEPVFYDASFSLRLMHDDAIDKIPVEHRATFVHVVNTWSKYVYETFGIESLLQKFYGKPYTEEIRLELIAIIESYICMHESIVEKKMPTALAESILIAINEKHVV